MAHQPMVSFPYKMFSPTKSEVFGLIRLAWSLLNGDNMRGHSKSCASAPVGEMQHLQGVPEPTSRKFKRDRAIPANDRGREPEEIAQLLRALGLYESCAAAPEVIELSEILSADYHEAPGLPCPQMARRLAGFAKSGIDPRRNTWRKWRTSEDFRVRLREFDSREIAVHAEPYTRGAGLSLWGFSCDARIGGSGAFVIFLNTAHQPGAVAATVAHELGHYIHRSIAAESCDAMAPLTANFVSHLDDDAELFSDSLAALSAYSIEALSTKRPSRSGSGWIEEIIHALSIIDPEYRIDFANKMVSPGWCMRYLAATIHFYKLRKALLETAGI